MEGGLGHMTALAPGATFFSDLLGGLRTDTLTSHALQYLKLPQSSPDHHSSSRETEAHKS